MNDVERNVLENADIIFLYKMDPPYGLIFNLIKGQQRVKF